MNQGPEAEARPGHELTVRPRTPDQGTGRRPRPEKEVGPQQQHQQPRQQEKEAGLLQRRRERQENEVGHRHHRHKISASHSQVKKNASRYERRPLICFLIKTHCTLRCA